MLYRILIVILLIGFGNSINAQVGLFEKPETSRKKEEIKKNPYKNRRDEKGRRQGDWMRFHPNGNPAYKARFKDDQPIDTLTRYYKNGKKFVEIVFDDETNRGKGKFFSEQGDLLGEGFFLNMQKDSIWRFYDEEGHLKSKEMFQFNKREGASKVFFDSGQLASEVNYEEGQKQGLEKRYYPGGELRVTVTYKDGKLNGPYSVFFKNGQKEIDGFYTNNKRDKTWVFYDVQGNKKMTLIFENGQLQNEDRLNEKEMEEFKRYEENRKRLKDPANFQGRPEEYIRNSN